MNLLRMITQLLSSAELVSLLCLIVLVCYSTLINCALQQQAAVINKKALIEQLYITNRTPNVKVNDALVKKVAFSS